MSKLEELSTAEPEAWRYWKDKFGCWQYSDCDLVFPSVPAGTQMKSLFTQDPRPLAALLIQARDALLKEAEIYRENDPEDAEPEHIASALAAFAAFDKED